MPKKLFVKGQSGNPSGKPKDPKSPKRKARIKVQEILDMLDFSPFEEMVKLYREDNTKPRVKVDILIELCSYIAPKLKHVEISSDDENPFIINLTTRSGLPRATQQQVVLDEINDDEDDDK